MATRIFHEPSDLSGRRRDLFPLPCLPVDDIVKSGLSRSVRRRIQVHGAENQRINKAVRALNLLWFGGGHVRRDSIAADKTALPLVQQDALSHITRCVKLLGPPPDDACYAGALSALRVASSSYTEPEPGVGSVVNMDLQKLSLPTGVAAGVSLVDHLEGPVKNMVLRFEDYMLEDADSWMLKEGMAGSVPPYNDRLLQNRAGYLKFTKRLFEAGVLGFTDTCRGRVGAFSVAKKPKTINGVSHDRQRLVLDCRQTNLQFKAPPLTELASLASLSQIVLDPDKELFIAGADIRDCFYAVNCPPGMCEFFCLKGDLDLYEAEQITGGQYSFDGFSRIIPCIKVLPMGFNWSFFLIQTLHEQATMSALRVGRDSLVIEGHRPPRLQPGGIIAMPYCDNVHTLSHDQASCQRGCEQVCDDLRGMGFSLHEEAPASTSMDTLRGCDRWCPWSGSSFLKTNVEDHHGL